MLSKEGTPTKVVPYKLLLGEAISSNTFSESTKEKIAGRFQNFLTHEGRHSADFLYTENLLDCTDKFVAGDFFIFMGDLLHAGAPNTNSFDRRTLFFNTQEPNEYGFKSDSQVHIGELTELLFGVKSAEQYKEIANHCISLKFDNDSIEFFLRMTLGAALDANARGQFKKVLSAQKKGYIKESEDPDINNYLW